jgi:hypothetical protein
VGIDFFGQTQVDYVTTGGNAFEYHDFNGNSVLTSRANTGFYPFLHASGGSGDAFVFIGSGFTDARAGQSITYVLDTAGTAHEFNQNNIWGADGDGKSYYYSLSGLYTAIDAGTDQFNVNELAGIGVDANLYTLSDSTTTYMKDTNTGNVVQVSAGWHGDVGYLTSGGGAFYFNVATSPINGTFITGGATGITVGTNTDGSSLIYLTGGANQIATWSVANGFTLLPIDNVATIGKANNGVLDLVFTNGQVNTLDSNGLHYVAKGGSTSFGSVS